MSLLDSQEFSCVFPSSLGWMAACWKGPRLARLTFGHRSARRAARAIACNAGADRRPPKEHRRLMGRLQAYAEGSPDTPGEAPPDDFLDVAIEENHLTRFQRRVVYHCRRIRWGRTISYGELAALAGSPGAARAVGNVMAANRFPIVVPCHRVVGAGGRLGGFSAPSGLRMKRRLLRMEGHGSLCACPRSS